jgi:predicted DNA-binding transcriptional regulator YafY
MDRTERFYRIQRLLRERRFVSLGDFLTDLGVSKATFKRDLEYLRDRLQAPIEYNREHNAYELLDPPEGQVWQLPGLWFSPTEMHALLTVEHLLEKLQPGLLAQQVSPLRARIAKILGSGELPEAEVRRRIRILPMAAREVDAALFEVISTAVLQRRRVLVLHHNRATDERLERVLSPQRLVHYRYNWYVDAWCHLRQALRTFAVDAIERATALPDAAREVPDGKLDYVFGAGYGIFAGHRTQRAVLQFSPVRARWVSREVWHPEQEGHLELDGSWVLELPYSDERELVMEILKHGADVRVLAPDDLRERVVQALRQASAQYE